MSDRQIDNLSKDIPAVIDLERPQADLSDDMGMAIENGGGHTLGPDNLDEGEVVGLGVDGVEELVAESELGRDNHPGRVFKIYYTH